LAASVHDERLLDVDEALERMEQKFPDNGERPSSCDFSPE
jgi:hypothetical protein